MGDGAHQNDLKYVECGMQPQRECASLAADCLPLAAQLLAIDIRVENGGFSAEQRHQIDGTVFADHLHSTWWQLFGSILKPFLLENLPSFFSRRSFTGRKV
jgi:hypothetical protein